MTIILTNDDGIDAPGIRALSKALGREGIIVAPKEPHSGCGHRVTTQKPIHIDKRSLTEYAIDGTPADCTRIAVKHLNKHTKWVLSGINAGGNLGVDVYISVTVAAVREAAMHGIPGIAISHWIKRPLTINWELATKWTEKVLDFLWDKTLETGSFWNVNLPHLETSSPEPKIIFCQGSTHPLPVNYRVEGDLCYYYGEYANREHSKGTDVDVCFSGNIAVTLIKL